MRILRIRHLTIAVRYIDTARKAFEDLFGAEAFAPTDVDAFGARTQDLAVGESTLQLAAPLDGDGALQRFIDRRGEGVYTVALEVEDLDAAVDELAARGIRVSEPVEAQPGVRSAFVTARATHGMSVQLVEAQATGAGEEPDTTIEPALAPDNDASKKPLDLTPDEWSDVE